MNSQVKNKSKYRRSIVGIINSVTLEEIHRMKPVCKKKLINDRELVKVDIKAKHKEIDELKLIYNPEIITRVEKTRENELRSTIYHISKCLHNRKENIQESTTVLYSQVLNNINDIYTKLVNEIDDKRNDILDRINLRLTDCNYRQRKMLNEKILEQETILRNLHAFTYDMQRVKENYEIIRKKINTLYEEDYDLEQKIKDENNKYNQLYFLFKQMKEDTNKIKIHLKESKEQWKTNNEKTLQDTSTISSKRIKSRPITSTLRYETTDSNSTHCYTKTEPKDKSCVMVLSKNLNEMHGKKRSVLKAYNNNIPQNDLYTIITQIMDKKKAELSSTHSNKQINQLPMQNHDFRKEFMDELLNDVDLKRIINDESYPVITIFKSKVFSK